MHSQGNPVLKKRKRQLSVDLEHTTVLPPPPAKRQQRHRTPSSYWDNLSRQWLTRRTLREFDRRTVWPAAPLPLDRSGKEKIRLEQLQSIARRGGPDLGDLRNYPEPGNQASTNRYMASSQSGSRKRARTGQESDSLPKTKRRSAYDPTFKQHLIDHGIYPDGYPDARNVQEPQNLEEIQTRLAEQRASLSPSRFTHDAFLDFKTKNNGALTETTVMNNAFQIVAGSATFPSEQNLTFGNLEDLTDDSITKAQPDLYDGSRPAEINADIRTVLGHYIVPSTNTAAPCLPNFFVEGKGPDGRASICNNQALYDGALGARGMHELRAYVDPETAYDGNAYTITSTYSPEILSIYATHPSPSKRPKISTEYRMTLLHTSAMNDPGGFRRGAGALRNARDWAKEKREELIAAANGKVLNAEYPVSSTQSFVSSPADEHDHTSETSTDELVMDVGTIGSSRRKAPAGVRTLPVEKGASTG